MPSDLQTLESGPKAFAAALKMSLSATPPVPAAVILPGLGRFGTVNGTMSSEKVKLCFEWVLTATRPTDGVLQLPGEQFVLRVGGCRSASEARIAAEHFADLFQRSDCVEFFQPPMEERLAPHHALTVDLRKVLLRWQFELHDHLLIGFEAVLRWKDPQVRFIPHASLIHIDQLHNLGARLAMDDFDSGCSPFGQLAHHPYDAIKIDCALVGIDFAKREIVQTVVTLARGLEMVPLVEGVQSKEDLHAALVDGCNPAQGYLFGKAAPAEELGSLVTTFRQGAPALMYAGELTP